MAASAKGPHAFAALTTSAAAYPWPNVNADPLPLSAALPPPRAAAAAPPWPGAAPTFTAAPPPLPPPRGAAAAPSPRPSTSASALPSPRLTARSSARELAVKEGFERVWNAHSRGAPFIRYGGRQLEKMITALRLDNDALAKPATSNDALFLLKAWGVPDGELEHFHIEKEKLKQWWVHEIFGYQGHLLNTLLTRHVLGKPRPSFHQLPPGNVQFGKSTVNQEPGIIRELVEGNFAQMCERRPPPIWPPPRRVPGDDGKVHGVKTARPGGARDLFELLSYAHGRVMGEGKEHSYAPVEGMRKTGGLPAVRHTRGSALQLALTKGLYVPEITSARPSSARPASARTASARPQSARL